MRRIDEIKISFTELPPEYAAKLKREEEKAKKEKTNPDVFIAKVLDGHDPITGSIKKISYMHARKLLWSVITYRLNKQCKKYIIEKEVLELIQQLLLYFCNVQPGEEIETPKGIVKATLPLRKGIWLCGETGIGKTFLMECFAIAFAWLDSMSSFRIVNMRNLETSLQMSKDISIIEKYCTTKWCFDDVGLEKKTKVFGNDIEIFESLINVRYEHYERFGLITHCTSNYPLVSRDSSEVISKLYSPILASRVRAMFTEIRMPGSDKRK